MTEIQKLTNVDIEELVYLQPEGWPDIREAFKNYLDYKFCMPVAIKKDKQIVATGTAIEYKNTGWLAHIIVAENERGKGLGKQIVNYLCDYLISKRKSSILLMASPAGRPLYLKYGFTDVTEYIRYNKPKESLTKNLSEAPVLKEDDKSEILKMDQIISGEDRRNYLSLCLDKGYCIKKGKTVTGYYLPLCGEGVVVALDTETAEKLMRIRSEYSNWAVVPSVNKEACSYYEKAGYESSLVVTRMFIGKKLVWKADSVYNRIGGNWG